MTWFKNPLASLSTSVSCGPLEIKSFYTKSGPLNFPLDPKLFMIDKTASVITIYSTSPIMAGTYLIYYDVGLENYPAVKKTGTPFKVTVHPTNSAPYLSGLV